MDGWTDGLTNCKTAQVTTVKVKIISGVRFHMNLKKDLHKKVQNALTEFKVFFPN